MYQRRNLALFSIRDFPHKFYLLRILPDRVSLHSMYLLTFLDMRLWLFPSHKTTYTFKNGVDSGLNSDETDNVL